MMSIFFVALLCNAFMIYGAYTVWTCNSNDRYYINFNFLVEPENHYFLDLFLDSESYIIFFIFMVCNLHHIVQGCVEQQQSRNRWISWVFDWIAFFSWKHQATVWLPKVALQFFRFLIQDIMNVLFKQSLRKLSLSFNDSKFFFKIF